MEREEPTTSNRGAGGKLPPPLRKPRPTPYSRPPTQTRTQTQTQNEAGGGSWWLSKLVDPATRLITGGATKLFPSFFSTPTRQLQLEHQQDIACSEEVEQDASDEEPEGPPDVHITGTTEGGPVPLQTESGPNVDERAEDTSRHLSEGTGISEIEQLMKGKTFSRDDLNRLTELLQTRIADQSDAYVNGKKNEGAAEERQKVTVKEKEAVPFSRVMGDVSPRLNTSVQDPVGASPVHIAKVYMEGRMSGSGFGSRSVMATDERTPLPATPFSPNPSLFSPAPKSSIRWPYAMVQEQRAYLTPQAERKRIGLNNLPRTPYSRPVHSRSTSKLPGFGDRAVRSVNISSTHWKQSQTPVYGDSQVASTRISSLGDGFGSVGPIRRTPRKFVGATPSKGTSLLRPATSSPFWAERTDAPKSFSPMVDQKYEPGPSTSSGIKFLPTTSAKSRVISIPVDIEAPISSVGVSTVHPQSSDTARKILEHLDRNIPTPKKKYEELERATSWRKPASSQLTTTISNALSSDPHIDSSDSQLLSFVNGKKMSDQGKEVREPSLPKVQREQCKTGQATDAVNTISEGGFACGGVSLNPKATVSGFEFNRLKVPVGVGESSLSETNQQIPQSQFEGQDVSRFLRSDFGSEALNIQNKPPRQTISSKPALASISTGKADPRRAAFLDNGSGFSFQVSSSSGALSEPPTPSIMPSVSASSLPHKEENTKGPSISFVLKEDGPSYSFGSKKFGQSPVFSFPSVNSSNSECRAPKFTFGSDKARISFRSVTEDAVCL